MQHKKIHFFWLFVHFYNIKNIRQFFINNKFQLFANLPITDVN